MWGIGDRVLWVMKGRSLFDIEIWVLWVLWGDRCLMLGIGDRVLGGEGEGRSLFDVEI